MDDPNYMQDLEFLQEIDNKKIIHILACTASITSIQNFYVLIFFFFFNTLKFQNLCYVFLRSIEQL
jgi:hypothetical protein